MDHLLDIGLPGLVFLGLCAWLIRKVVKAARTERDLEEQPSVVPLPRMTVLLYRTLPFFWYGTLYFCFLFADRFAASVSVSALTGAPFGLRPQYKLGMDLALLTFLFASAAVEYGNIRFTRLLTRAMREPFDPDARAFRLRRIPQGRLGDADGDLGGAAVYLASAASDYVTGHTLVVDGGTLAAY